MNILKFALRSKVDVQGVNSRRWRVSLQLSTAILLGSIPTVGFAQAQASAGTADQGDSGDIIVTANKREQSAQSVGIAVTALGADALASLGRQDITSIAKLSPSVQIQPLAGPTLTVINIRGVSQNDFSDNQEAPVAFYNDGVYIGSMGATSGMTFDLDRVEVLRGPQGTLFGRNATGGLVQIITAKPTKTLEGYLTVSAESRGAVTTEGAISGPLSDRVRARLSIASNIGGAYFKNFSGPNLGGQKFYAARGQVAADVGAEGALNLKVQYMRNDHERTVGIYGWRAAAPNALFQGEFLGPNDLGTFYDLFTGLPYTTCPGCDGLGYKEPDNNPYTGSLRDVSSFTRTYWSGTASYEQPISDDVKLTSVTDYQHMSKRALFNDSVGPSIALYSDSSNRFWQLSQELRLSGQSNNLQWVVGAYGLKMRSNSPITVDFSNRYPGFVPTANQTTSTRSFAVFGQVEYALSEQITAIGGLRYTWDKKYTNYLHYNAGVLDYEFNRSTAPNLASRSDNDWSGKFELDFKPNANTLLYASINRGIKSGGFNRPQFTPSSDAVFNFGPETLTSLEGGAKLTLLDRLATLNVSGFHYWYDGYQGFQTQGLEVNINNLKARLYGAEVELNLRPARGLLIQTYGTYTHAKVFGVILPVVELVVDRRMPLTPRWSTGALARYSFDLGGGQASIQANAKYNSSQYFSMLNEPVNREDGYLVADARISYRPASSPVEISLFVNNLTNKAYRLLSNDLSGVSGNVEQFYAKPRIFGISLTANLN